MIVRIVRMHFTKEGAQRFLNIFQTHREAIRNVEGCLHLELLQDVNDPNIFSTLSHWEDESYLNRYRASALFGQVWKPVKQLFSKNPEVYSFRQVP